MDCSNLHISVAGKRDVVPILDLLALVNLPHEGVEEHLDGFIVAKNSDGRLAGTIGLERYGSVGLLRSAAVMPGMQKCGVGACLTSALLERAAGDGVEKVVLLTSTARDFFAGKFGFVECERRQFDEQLGHSDEWNLPRCSTAVCMSLDLQRRG